MGFSFELCVDMLDYMDDILSLQTQGESDRSLSSICWERALGSESDI